MLGLFGILGVEGKSATVGDFCKGSQDWTGLDDACRKDQKSMIWGCFGLVFSPNF